jgi:hypothetical protein
MQKYIGFSDLSTNTASHSKFKLTMIDCIGGNL